MTQIMDAIMATAGRTLLDREEEGNTLDPAAVLTATWDACLCALSEPKATPDTHLNRLAGLMWQLCGSRTVTTAATDEVKTISFLAMNEDEKLVGAVLIPDNWVKMFAVEPWMQLGAIVHTASKARDFWNGRILDVNVERRARAFEYLALALAVKDTSASRKFAANDYQKKVLAEFEAGVPKGLLGDSRPFDLERARAAFRSFSKLEIRPPLDATD
jgi:hypothetical protein